MLKVVISVTDIDYGAVADAVPPGKLGGILGKAALGLLPQGMKDDLVVGMIRKKRPQIIEKLNDLLKKNDIAAAVDCMTVEKRDGVEVCLALVFRHNQPT